MAKSESFGPFGFLKALTETPGVSGREERVRELILRVTEGMWDETRVDPMGNLICVKRATKKAAARAKKSAATEDRPQRVMLSCHMDEIGFYVRYIDDEGFVRVHNAGGFDTRNLFSRRVLIQGREDLIGLLNPAGKPVHIASEEDKKKVPEVHEVCIDLLRPAADVKKLVEIGDPVTLHQQTEQLGHAITGKAMDNRVALWVGVNAVRLAHGLGYLELPDEHTNGFSSAAKKSARRPAGKGGKSYGGSAYDIYFVACVQEEVGLRGATTAAFGIDPDIGIAVDTTLACDTPGIGKEQAITQFGKGVGIKVMDAAVISHRGLFDEFVDLAKREKIPFQREVLTRGSTEAGMLQRTRAGTRAITLSIPTRYIHTVTESIHRTDATAAVDLLAAWLAK